MTVWVLYYQRDSVCGVTDDEQLAKRWAAQEYCDTQQFELNAIVDSPFFGAKPWPPKGTKQQ